MNSQWGRSGNGPAQSNGSGLGSILFASVVSLALGAAGGYGAFRMAGSPAASEVDQRDQRIADLARELDARVAQVEESTQKAQALTAENATLKRQIETLPDNSGMTDAAIAIAENAKLTQEIVPALKNELELSSQRVADAEALKKRAEEAVLDGERQLSMRADDIARLEKALEQARSQQATTLSAETGRQRAEADALRRQLTEMREETARKDREIAALNAGNASLTARISTLETAARSAQQSGPEDSAQKPARDNARPADSRSPRNAALVADVMQGTPGLDRLTGSERDQLERTLVSGECVTNALGGVFKRVPVLTLRNLMRGLDSDC